MGNLFTNPETKEYLWCSNASRTCAECIANNLDFPNANTILYQLLRLSMVYNAKVLPDKCINENVRASMKNKFIAALTTSLPTLENTGNLWIIHYSPVTIIVGEKSRREGFFVIDRTSLYFFILPEVCCGGCGGSLPLENYEELRIPLVAISSVDVNDTNENDFTITAVLRSVGNTVLKWSNSSQLQERCITVHSTRRNEILRVLRSMLNTINYGEPFKCRWLNAPSAVAALGGIVPEEYLDQRANGCFEAKFLAHVYSSPTVDEPCVVPDVWAATAPPFVHVYRDFFKRDYGSRVQVPRAANGLYELVGLDQNEPGIGAALWAHVPNRERLNRNCPPHRLPGLVDSCTGQLLMGAPTGTVRIFDLHGTEYGKSSNTPFLSDVCFGRTVVEPGYELCGDGSMLAGGIRWHLPSQTKETRLVALEQVVVGALRAIVNSQSTHTLNFDRTCMTNLGGQLTALEAMVDVCRHNGCLTSVSFPYCNVPATAPKITEAWLNMGKALISNPKPRFTSIDVRGGNMGDAGLIALLPGLVRLFHPTQGLGLRPVSLRFDNNNLSAAAVWELCTKLLHHCDLSDLQELSLGANPWTDTTKHDAASAVVRVVKSAPALRVLNIQSKFRSFSQLPALQAALVESACPLETLAVGGSPLLAQDCDGWTAAMVGIARSKETTLTSLLVPGLQLPAGAVCALVAQLPSVHVNLSEGGVSGEFPGPHNEMSSQVQVRSLNLAKNSAFVLQWWVQFPRHLVELDLSDTLTGSDTAPLHSLTQAINGITSPIALQNLSVARIVFQAATRYVFKDFLEAVLLSQYVSLKRLDVSSCRGGLIGLQTLGSCLRKNRSLTSLQFDDQAYAGDVFDLAEGWKALRGCFYGNKKIVELSYPWRDISCYFFVVAKAVQSGWARAAAVKSSIGAAHRAGNMPLKRRRIQEIIAVKCEFKAKERVRTQSITTLHDIYDSVRQNKELAEQILANKLAGKRVNQNAIEYREKMAAKQFGLLAKLKNRLVLLAGKRPVDASVEPWQDLTMGLAAGPRLFTSQHLHMFVTAVQAVGGEADANLGRTLKSCDALTAQLVDKASLYGCTAEDLADDIKKDSPGLFDEFALIYLLDVPSKKSPVHKDKAPKQRPTPNKPSAEEIRAQKLAAKRVTPKALEFNEKVAVKQLDLLTKLKNRLVLLAGKRPVDANVEPWQDLTAGLAAGPHLFTPQRLHMFVTAVRAVGSEADANMSRTLRSCDALTAQLVDKASLYGCTAEELADDIKKGSPGLFDELALLNLLDVPIKAAAAKMKALGGKKLAPSKLTTVIPTRTIRQKAYKMGKMRRTNKKNDSDDDGSEDPERDNNDGGHSDQDMEDDCRQSSSSDEEAEGDDDGDDEEEGGADDQEDCNDATDVDDAVLMYAGAGPQDLPDGDPDHDQRNDPAASGRRWSPRVWSCTKLTKAPCRTSEATVALPARHNLARQLQKRWQQAVGDAIDHSADVLLRALEYKSIRHFCSTQASATAVGRACTLVTQCSVDRLDRLEQQARAWAGDLSVAVYISTQSAEETRRSLEAVRALVQALSNDASYHGRLDVSVLYGHEDSPWQWDCTVPGAADGPLYPINALRNLAVSAVTAASRLLFLVDVDFVPSVGLEAWVQQGSEASGLVERCEQGDVIVVPAFERMTGAGGDAAMSLQSVCAALDQGSLTAFHVQHFPAGHSPTNYPRWRELSEATEIDAAVVTTFPVTYADYYEPYVVMARARFVPYDERFRGYGLNKCVHLRALAERGASFHVLPGHYLVAACHEKSEAHQRTYGSESGYRKHVVAAAYRAALRDIQAGALPVVSASTSRLLRPARPNKSSNQLGGRMKKEMKAALERMLVTAKHMAMAPVLGDDTSMAV